MKLSPRMVVLALIAISTLMVLSLSVLGARFVAETYVAQRDAETTSSPTPTIAPPVVSDEAITDLFTAHFPQTRLQSGGDNIVVFIIIDNDDVSDIAAKIELIATELRTTGSIETATLVLNYGQETFDTKEIQPLVTDSVSAANQLVIQLR